MATTDGGDLKQIPFRVPDPPREFGQDGGIFYRLYDNIAEEIDEDMAKGLKEQLDGLLIFAGLFAGVNSAFLALTLPLLSADPADDTNALLAQNNAILMQLMQGRNDTSLGNSTLPSTSFSPPHGIFTVNILFSFSLTLAIISSFLAVLGRQWLVYYRKRSGGGPDRQRWEQLRRFLGAERWRLEFVLDDILPSLLQIGLVLFCVSLILYLHILNPSISRIVRIPMCLGLAIFVLGALFTVWDRFCPFQSPLSHLLCWVTNPFLFWSSPIWQIISMPWPKSWPIVPITWNLLWLLAFYVAILLIPIWLPLTSLAYLFGLPVSSIFRDILSLYSKSFDGLHPASFSDYLTGPTLREAKNEAASLQVVALKRTICTSDDPLTLLCATANILTIETRYLAELWSDETFQSRFLELCTNPHQRMVQLLGRDRNEAAISAARLYRGALCHIFLLLRLFDYRYEESKAYHLAIGKILENETLDDSSWLIPPDKVNGSSPALIETALASWMVRAYREFVPVERIGSYITECSDSLSVSSWKLVSLIVYILTKSPHSADGMGTNIIQQPPRLLPLQTGQLGDRVSMQPTRQPVPSADTTGPTQYISTMPGGATITQHPPQQVPPLQTGRVGDRRYRQGTGQTVPPADMTGPILHISTRSGEVTIIQHPPQQVPPLQTGRVGDQPYRQGTGQTVSSADMTGPTQHIFTRSGEATIIQPPPQTLPLPAEHVAPPSRVIGTTYSALEIESLQSAYAGNVGKTLTTLETVAIDLARQRYASDLLDCHRILQNIMKWAREVIIDESRSSNTRVGDKLGLLYIAEQVLRIEDIPVRVRDTARMLRKDFVTMLRLRFMTGDAQKAIPPGLLVLFGNLFFKLGTRDENYQRSNEEDLLVLQLFGPLLRELYSYPIREWRLHDESLKKLYDEVRQVYDQFRAKVDRASRTFQSDRHRNRDPEISWRPRMEELHLDLPAQNFPERDPSRLSRFSLFWESSETDNDWTGLRPIWREDSDEVDKANSGSP